MNSEEFVAFADGIPATDQKLPGTTFEITDPGLADYYKSDVTKKLEIDEIAETYGVDERAVLRKIDFYILPPFCLLYFISFINKSSFGLYGLYGMLQSYQITTNQFAGLVAYFLIPYAVFQFFANVVLKYVRPHFYIGGTVLMYGALQIGGAWAKTYHQFIIIQVFHGFLHSGTEVCIYYILAHYYSSSESQLRYSLIYSMNSVGAIVSACIAYAASIHLVGQKGILEPWRWISIIIGAMTMFTALLLFFLFPDFPEGARFFTDDETLFVVKKLEICGGKSGYTLNSTYKDILKCLKDPLIYLPALVGYCNNFYCQGISTNLPLALYTEMSFTGIQTAARLSYIWLVAFGCLIAVAILSVYMKQKSILYFFWYVPFYTGITITMYKYAESALPKYRYLKWGADVLIVCSAYTSQCVFLCWTTMNWVGHLRKSVGITMQVALGSLGSITAVYVFRDGYQGIMTCFPMAFVAIIISLVYLGLLIKYNREKRTVEYKEKWNLLSEKEKIFQGDKSPNFDYGY